MDTTQVLTVIISAVTTGGISTFATVTALKVHINYLKESVTDLKKQITRAHERIDKMEPRG